MFLRSLFGVVRSSGKAVRCYSSYHNVIRSATQTAPSIFMLSSQTSVSPSPLISPLKKIGILDVPISIDKIISDKPKLIIPVEDKQISNEIEDPTKVIKYQAARLVVIRRRKMRRHKLKKLRKKMKFVWAKVRQKREMRKEKAFQAELMGQIAEAQKFNPVLYAKEKIDKSNATIIPKLWKGKRLPEFVIKELIAEKNAKLKEREERFKRRESMNLKVSDYKV